MPEAKKFSTEEKVAIAEAYLNGCMGKTEIKKQYGISWTTLRSWVQRHEMRGATGLAESKRYRKYDPETKEKAVVAYLDGEGSLNHICRKHDISDARMLRRWIKRYNSHGDFKQANSGGAIYMAKGRKTTLEERIEIVSHCIGINKDYGRMIEQYGISYAQIYGWVRKYEKDGPDGLADHRGKRKDEASMSEIEKLHAQLKLKEAENLNLRMENELLKKLKALERGRNRD